MIAKVCARESRRDLWFENRLVFSIATDLRVGELAFQNKNLMEKWHIGISTHALYYNSHTTTDRKVYDVTWHN